MMKRLVVVVLASVLMVPATFGVAGCVRGGRNGPTDGEEGSTTDAPAVGKVTVTREDDGGTVELSMGQTLVVELDSNATTGYSWRVTKIDEDIVEQEGDGTYVQTGDPDAMGAGGIETFEFKSVASGRTRLELSYVRSFEEEDDPRTFGLEVVVR